MSENENVLKQIMADPTSPYYGDGSRDSVKAMVYNLLRPGTNQFDNPWHKFQAEMSDDQFYNFMVWHRGLSIPRARDLNDADVQRGKELFISMGCAHCHRPQWTTGDDNYWSPNNISLPHHCGDADSRWPTPALKTDSTTAVRATRSKPSCGTAIARTAKLTSLRRSSTSSARRIATVS